MAPSKNPKLSTPSQKTAPQVPDPVLLLSSTAGSHLFRDRSVFSSYSPHKQTLTTISSNTVEAVGRGDVHVRIFAEKQSFTLWLRDCRHAPDLNVDILSISRLIDNNYQVMLTTRGSRIIPSFKARQGITSTPKYFPLTRNKGQFFLKFESILPDPSTSLPSANVSIIPTSSIVKNSFTAHTSHHPNPSSRSPSPSEYSNHDPDDCYSPDASVYSDHSFHDAYVTPPLSPPLSSYSEQEPYTLSSPTPSPIRSRSSSPTPGEDEGYDDQPFFPAYSPPIHAVQVRTAPPHSYPVPIFNPSSNPSPPAVFPHVQPTTLPPFTFLATLYCLVPFLEFYRLSPGERQFILSIGFYCGREPAVFPPDVVSFFVDPARPNNVRVLASLPSSSHTPHNSFSYCPSTPPQSLASYSVANTYSNPAFNPTSPSSSHFSSHSDIYSATPPSNSFYPQSPQSYSSSHPTYLPSSNSMGVQSPTLPYSPSFDNSHSHSSTLYSAMVPSTSTFHSIPSSNQCVPSSMGVPLPSTDFSYSHSHSYPY